MMFCENPMYLGYKCKYWFMLWCWVLPEMWFITSSSFWSFVSSCAVYHLTCIWGPMTLLSDGPWATIMKLLYILFYLLILFAVDCIVISSLGFLLPLKRSIFRTPLKFFFFRNINVWDPCRILLIINICSWWTSLKEWRFWILLYRLVVLTR